MTERRGLTSAGLKYLACLFMLADHAGSILLPEVGFLRCVGRLAFPIFAFMIANGYRHTSDPEKYLLRLVIFAALFQWPYSFIMENGFLNILFTLAAGLAAIRISDILDKRIANSTEAYACGIAVAAAFALLAWLMDMEYGWYGVLMIYTAWLFFDNRRLLTVAWALLTGAYVFSGIPDRQLFALAALIFIFLYNGEKGRGSKWFFYIFYVAHIILLYLLRVIFF